MLYILIFIFNCESHTHGHLHTHTYTCTLAHTELPACLTVLEFRRLTPFRLRIMVDNSSALSSNLKLMIQDVCSETGSSENSDPSQAPPPTPTPSSSGVVLHCNQTEPCRPLLLTYSVGFVSVHCSIQFNI